MPKSIIVAGGGLIGCAAALRLRASGFDVLLVDPGDQRRGASFGNAGHIGSEQCDPWPSLHNLLTFPRHLFLFGGPLDFPLAQLPRWLPWSFRFMWYALPHNMKKGERGTELLLKEPIAAWQRLLTLADAPALVAPVGHNSVWMSAQKADAGFAAWRRANTGTATFREMTREELAKVGGALKDTPAAGLHFVGTGQIVQQPQAVRDALLRAFAARGGQIKTSSVVTIVPSTGSVRVVCGDGSSSDAENVLVSAGPWSGTLMAQLGARVPLIAERGYHIQSAEHAWPLDLPPTLFEERSVIVTRFADRLRSTSFLEFSQPEAPADARKWAKLEWHLADLGIVFSKSPERWMGSRPTLPDYLPAIGRMKANPRVLYAFGHQHLGLTLAAVTAEVVDAVANETRSPVELKPFAVERF